MSSDKNQIAFRRIKGRIVPIRLNKQQKDQAKGVAMVGAGIGLGVAAGRSQRWVDRMTSKKLDRFRRSAVASVKFGLKSRLAGQGTLEGFATAAKSKKFGSAAKSYLKSAGRLVKANMAVRPAMILGAGAITAAGAFKVSRDKSKESRAAKAAAFGSAASAIAFSTGYLGRKHLKRMAPILLRKIRKGF